MLLQHHCFDIRLLMRNCADNRTVIHTPQRDGCLADLKTTGWCDSVIVKNL